jgi:hypothetical protein
MVSRALGVFMVGFLTAVFGILFKVKKNGAPTGRAGSSEIESELSLVPEVNTNIKARMVPVRMMIAAPLPVGIHARDIMIHLRAVLAMLRDVAVNSCPVCLQPLVAVIRPIPVAKRGLPHRQSEQHCRSGNKSEPNSVNFHSFLQVISGCPLGFIDRASSRAQGNALYVKR